MKILYITYENLYKTAILQAMVVKPLDMMNKKYNIDFCITSAIKEDETDDIYKQNKELVKKNTTLCVKEFKKNLTKKQSIFTFLKDIIPIILFSIKEAKNSDIIHCRSYGGAIIGKIASFFTGKPYIFDMRGVLPEETVEVGKISKSSLKYKLMKLAENILIKRAAYVITVSNKFNDYVKKEFNKKKCENTYNPTDFNSYYKNNRNDGKVNFIYSGSMQVWHLPELTIEYYSKIYEKYKDKVYMYFCTNDINKANAIFQKFGLPKSSYEINTVPFNKMPEFYSKADVAFCFIKESFSKSVCFPVKFSEYIASELFVLANENIGDIPDIIKQYQCGIVFEDLNTKEKNLTKIYSIVDNLLFKTHKGYSRLDLDFLNWQYQGIEKIYQIYKKIGDKNER